MNEEWISTKIYKERSKGLRWRRRLRKLWWTELMRASKREVKRTTWVNLDWSPSLSPRKETIANHIWKTLLKKLQWLVQALSGVKIEYYRFKLYFFSPSHLTCLIGRGLNYFSFFMLCINCLVHKGTAWWVL